MGHKILHTSCMCCFTDENVFKFKKCIFHNNHFKTQKTSTKIENIKTRNPYQKYADIDYLMW